MPPLTYISAFRRTDANGGSRGEAMLAKNRPAVLCICVRFTKTSKTPLMMSVAFGPTSCSSGLVPKSKLLQRPESHDGFVPKHCHHGGKNHALRAKKQDYRYPYIVDGLENVHVASASVQIISFTLVTNRSKVV